MEIGNRRLEPVVVVWPTPSHFLSTHYRTLLLKGGTHVFDVGLFAEREDPLTLHRILALVEQLRA